MSDSFDELKQRIERIETELNSVKAELDRASAVPSSAGQKTEAQITPKNPSDAAIQIKLKNTAGKARTSEILKSPDQYLGGNLFGKLGFAAIVLGTGWFVKFSFDRQWLNESARIMLGITAGLFILLFALHTARKKVKILPPAAAGASFAVLFLSIWSAYYFYGFLGHTETFLYFFALVMISALLSWRSGSETLYLFSYAGTLLSPLLMSSGENSYGFLFSYLTLITFIYFLISIKGKWKFTPLTVLSGNYAVYSAWSAAHLHESSRTAAFLFISTIYALFMAREVYIAAVKTGRLDSWRNSAYFLNVLLYSAAAGAIIYSIKTPASHSEMFGVFTLAAASTLLGAQYVLDRKKAEGNVFRALNVSLFYTMAVSSAFMMNESEWPAAALVSMAGSLYYTGSLIKNEKISFLSVPFWVISFFYIIGIFAEREQQLAFIFNERMLLMLLMILPLAASYIRQRKNATVRFQRFTLVSVTFISLIAMSIELGDFIDDELLLLFSFSLLFAAYSGFFYTAGFLRKNQDLKKAGAVFAAIIVAKLYLIDIWVLGIILKIIALFGLGSGLIAVSYFYNRHKKSSNDEENSNVS